MTGTVLIVDDDFDIRDSLADVLADEGYGVATASDGRQALDYLRSHPAPALILLDWMMPTMDGQQFRLEQCKDATLAEIPVILLTADMKISEKMETLSAKAYLRKPVELDTLLETIELHARR